MLERPGCVCDAESVQCVVGLCTLQNSVWIGVQWLSREYTHTHTLANN